AFWRIAPELVGKIAACRARFKDGGHAVIGEAVENVGKILAGVIVLREVETLAIAHVNVRVDKSRHHSFARQIDTCTAGGQADFALTSDLRNPIAGHDEGGVFDDSTIAGDQARTLE